MSNPMTPTATAARLRELIIKRRLGRGMLADLRAKYGDRLDG